MDVAALLDRIQNRRDFAGQLEHVELLPERVAQFAAISPPLPSSLTEILATRSICDLYSHQAISVAAARARRDFVVVTGTAILMRIAA